MKQCSKCKQSYSLTCFSKNKNTQDGLAFECKKCSLEYREKKRQHLRDYNKQYRIQNKEKLAASYKERYNKNIDKERARSARYRANSPEKVKATQKAYAVNNPEKRAEQRRKWLSKSGNKIKQKDAVQRCRERKPDQYLAYTHIRRAKIKGNGGTYTAKEWQDLCAYYGNVCLCCHQSRPLVVDHVMPISKGGTSNIENLQPLCKSCNSTKRDKDTDYRIKDNPRVELEINAE